MLQQALKQLLQFLATPTGNWVVIGVVSFIVLAIIYNKQRQIPGLTVAVIPEDTWFINRDDNHRLAIVVSLHLINKSSAPIRIRRCKLSGYSPKSPPEKLFLQGHDTTVELAYPAYDLFVDVGSHPAEHTSEYVLNPYTEQRMWVFYRSGIVTMTNMLRAPIVLRDVNRKRKALQIAVPRNMEQIQLYREAAMRW
ncbi:MAG: hypothetical protein OXU36_19460 [Candidatus Poribacteria bacterium]|nr:hypothetical protein [Candidatus Poribacteria bacterium]